jgi:hypothetical protein
LIKVGLGGPEGYYGTGEANSHFGIIQDDPKKNNPFWNKIQSINYEMMILF